MRLYVHAQTAGLLHHLSVQMKQLKHAPEGEDADAIHDLRVATRRLRECLRVFEAFFPAKQRRKVAEHLKTIMQACGEVRDRDMALGFLADAGVDESAPLLKRIRRERRSALRTVQKALRRWADSGLSRKFKAEMEG